MKQFDNNEINKKVIETKNKLKNLSLDYKKNFIKLIQMYLLKIF